MKWRSMLCALLISASVPAIAFGADIESARLATMRTLIDVLNEQILLLTAKLEAQQAASLMSTQTTRTVDDLKVSDFYDGTYTALYETNGGVLSPIGRTAVRLIDERLWDRFVALTGKRYALVNVQEFRVFADSDSPYDAFADLDTETGKWILGFNTYGIDFTEPSVWKEIDPILVHEYGHMLIDADQDLYTAFVTQFWSGSKYSEDDGRSCT
jgi:hypothetical protein